MWFFWFWTRKCKIRATVALIERYVRDSTQSISRCFRRSTLSSLVSSSTPKQQFTLLHCSTRTQITLLASTSDKCLGFCILNKTQYILARAKTLLTEIPTCILCSHRTMKNFSVPGVTSTLGLTTSWSSCTHPRAAEFREFFYWSLLVERVCRPIYSGTHNF